MTYFAVTSDGSKFIFHSEHIETVKAVCDILIKLDQISGCRVYSSEYSFEDAFKRFLDGGYDSWGGYLTAEAKMETFGSACYIRFGKRITDAIAKYGDEQKEQNDDR